MVLIPSTRLGEPGDNRTPIPFLPLIQFPRLLLTLTSTKTAIRVRRTTAVRYLKGALQGWSGPPPSLRRRQTLSWDHLKPRRSGFSQGCTQAYVYPYALLRLPRWVTHASAPCTATVRTIKRANRNDGTHLQPSLSSSGESRSPAVWCKTPWHRVLRMFSFSAPLQLVFPNEEAAHLIAQLDIDQSTGQVLVHLSHQPRASQAGQEEL